jgi:outer membrane receptor protein involved in Fe transport
VVNRKGCCARSSRISYFFPFMSCLVFYLFHVPNNFLIMRKLAFQRVLILFFVLVSRALFAQGGSVGGVVVDGDSKGKEPVIGAVVRILDGSADGTVVTDEMGRFAFVNRKSGVYVIQISYIGMEVLESKVVVPVVGGDGRYVLFSKNQLLNTATVTSGKFEKPLGEVTVSLDVVKPGIIESTNTRQVDDVLQKVSGVNIIDGQANIRGGSGFSYGAGSRVLLLVDDIPALQADAGSPNFNDIAVENIEQIEVVKGAASALYGSSAMNGIINIRTGFAKSEPETKISSSFTCYDSPQNLSRKWWGRGTFSPPFVENLSFVHKQKFKKLDLVLSGYYFNQSSFILGNYERYDRFTTGVRYRLSDSLVIGFNLNWNNGASNTAFYWKSDSVGSYIGANGSFNEVKKLRFFIDPYINYFDEFGNRHKLLMRYYSIDNLGGNKTNTSQLYYTEYQFQRNFKPLSLIFTGGVVGTFTNVDAQLYGDAKYSTSNYAFYTQLDKKFFERLNLSFGFRYEVNKLTAPEVTKIAPTIFDTLVGGGSSESKPVFRIGANYQLGKATFLRASWGEGYRFPTIAEQFINTNAGFPIIPNVHLVSETGWSAEFGLKQGYQLGDFKGFVDASVFRSEYANMMEFGINGKLGIFAFQSQNVGNTVIQGYEFSTSGFGRIGKTELAYQVGYTVLDPKFKEFTAADSLTSTAGYNVLKYRFKNSFKFDLQADYKILSVGASLQYNSNMDAVDKVFNFLIPGVRTFRDNHNTGFYILDFRVGVNVTKHLKLSALVKNFLNQEYTYRPALLEPPRNFSFVVGYKF